MRGFSLQLVVPERPYLLDLGAETCDHPTEWYESIGSHLARHVTGWTHKRHVARTMLFSNELQTLEGLFAEIPGPDEAAGELLVLDLSAHWFGKKSWNNLGLLPDERLAHFEQVAVVFNRCAGALRSDSLIRLYEAQEGEAGGFTVMDTTGRLYEFDDLDALEPTRVPELDRYAEPPSEDEFRRLILRRSVRFFGHYEVPSGSHVRTHYDLYRVQQDDAGYAYIRNLVSRLHRQEPFDLLVGFGIGKSALGELGAKLGSDLGISFLNLCEGSTGLLGERVLRGAMSTALLTDVVLTGDTAVDIKHAVEALDASVVHIISLVGLENTVKKLDGLPVTVGARLRRPYYRKGSCRLCDASGIMPPATVTSEEGFHETFKRRATSFDFWELVGETASRRPAVLNFGHSVSRNGINHYLVKLDTAPILAQYGDFVAGVTAAKIRAKLGSNLPEAVACPREAGALHLAYALADKLRLKSHHVIAIDREDIDTCAPAGGDHESILEKYPSLREYRTLLVVDDGINSLHTFKGLISLLRAGSAELVGYAVFINAAEETLLQDARETLGDKIFWFYRWPLAPFSAADCPLCSLKAGRPPALPRVLHREEEELDVDLLREQLRWWSKRPVPLALAADVLLRHGGGLQDYLREVLTEGAIVWDEGGLFDTLLICCHFFTQQPEEVLRVLADYVGPLSNAQRKQLGAAVAGFNSREWRLPQSRLNELLRWVPFTDYLVGEASTVDVTSGSLDPNLYDVALSFASEDRGSARKLKDQLKARGIRVFYDEDEQAELWGKDLYQHLQMIYRDRSTFVVILVSKDYARKAWPSHELRQAQERAFAEGREYILPIQIDDTLLPGMNTTTGYLRLADVTLEGVVDCLVKKLGSLGR